MLTTSETIREKGISAASFATKLYVSLLLLLMPLVLHNGLFDVVETKYVFFLLFTAGYFVCIAVCALLDARTKKELHSFRFSKAEVAVLLLLLLYALSFFGAAIGGKIPLGEALVGKTNRMQGVLTALLYAGVFLAVSRYTRLSSHILFFAAGAAAIVSVLAILNDLNFDPLRLYHNMRRVDGWRYIATLGNVDFYGNYLGLMLCLFLGGFILAKKRVSEGLLGGLLVLCGAAAVPSGSDAVALQLFVPLLLCPLLVTEQKHLARIPLAACLLLMGMGIPMLYRLWVDTRFYPPHFVRVLTLPAVLATLAVFLLSASFRTARSKRMFNKKTYGRVLLLLLAAGATALILCNTLFKDVSFGAFDRFIKLNGAWGTDRGSIYAHCMEAFYTFSPLEKLFGGGPDALLRYDAANRLFSDALLDAAHNEYLQLLLTVGVFGLACYLAFLFLVMKTGVRNAQKSRDPSVLGSLLAVIGYSVSAAVGIAQPVSTPFFYLFCALCTACYSTNEETREASTSTIVSIDSVGMNS